MSVEKITKAILNINPSAEVKVDAVDGKSNPTLDEATITWHNNTSEISKVDIQTKLDELQAEYDALAYSRKRKAEYPDIYDYIDGVVKSDQAQIDKYIADSQAVKDKYPKGA